MADRLYSSSKRREYKTRRDYGGIATWFQCRPTVPPPRNCLKEKSWATSIAVQPSYPMGQSSYSPASASAAASESPPLDLRREVMAPGAHCRPVRVLRRQKRRRSQRHSQRQLNGG